MFSAPQKVTVKSADKQADGVNRFFFVIMPRVMSVLLNVVISTVSGISLSWYGVAQWILSMAGR